ncbi:YbhB/YbcL family Raf kinase inhibitor-like protein [Actinomadura rayongensis]|uniref:YbhB/YbcL family Raf kinase inhibitor-like protein n=1 Tax=Actinomadura rayongensis TaxID=1429076 RepID=A0A6I4WHI4_9ACTN|nr:YbhB/YbcL family Raf kinase inhibitor-like protein [Actinomadura rayongensis]MXQ66444.1 YbhB/YbcL family Raf kinase inhibitor-like protein [Actinomadura rayongensis]
MSIDRRPALAAAGALALTALLSGCGTVGLPENASAELSDGFTVTSPAFHDGGDLPTRFACATYSGSDALGRTPPLRWSGAPTGTRSFAIVMDDPDASDGAYVHWVYAGIDGNRQELVEGTHLDKTVEGLNTGKKVGYRPPCPPKGERHRYRFTIYALNSPAPFANGAPLKDSLAAIAEHVIARGRITGNLGGR